MGHKNQISFFLFFLLFLIYSNSNAQQFSNLDFSRLCDSSKTGVCYWDLSWGGKGSVRPEKIDGKETLAFRGNAINAVAFTEQSASVSMSEMNILTVSASIRSDSIEGKGAGLNIGLYDAGGKLISSKDMGGLYSIEWIRGTKDWQTYAISIVCPITTTKIKVGIILYGKGKAWVKNYKTSLTPIGNRKPSKLAIGYISAACDSISKHSLVRDSINIIALRETALKIAGPAKKYSDCFLAINYLLESLRPFGDEHSFLMKVEELRNWEKEGSQVTKIENPSFRVIDQCGYIIVPPFHGGNPQSMLAYADSLQQGIQQLYNSGIKGWIVDLRQNTGGNMAPMIAGLGPLFSSEKLGSLIAVDGKPNAWYYIKGKYYWDDDAGWKVTEPVELPTKLPIAVLTGYQTGSSGEAVVVSFIGNEKARSFGGPTWGLTTGNGSFTLKDGSQIFLAATVMADRNGKQYRSSIEPDVTLASSSEPGKDVVLDSAIRWINNNGQ